VEHEFLQVILKASMVTSIGSMKIIEEIQGVKPFGRAIVLTFKR